MVLCTTAKKRWRSFCGFAIVHMIIEVKTYDVVLHVKAEKAAQIKSQIIDGQKCLIIPMDANENKEDDAFHKIIIAEILQTLLRVHFGPLLFF